ncbi:alpha/beta fold hydrolase [Altererythrobacter sp.]|nr:alpha/beta fold hydrolase [Altererythrobacter sp.]
MKRRYKFGIGCLAIIVALLGTAAYFWFSREPRPNVVAEAGVGGERVSINGLPANFYPGQGGGQRPAILLLGGSEGGLKETRNIFARQLAAEGYSVLYQSYFATSERNRSLDMIPLETFDAALDWLAGHPEIDAGPVAVIGHSKGAEAALLVATRDDRIGAVIAAMPSDVIWQGFDFDSTDMSGFRSSWNDNDRAMSYVPYQTLAFYEYFTLEAPMLTMFSRSRDAASRCPTAFLKIEETSAPIMLICGEADALWPGCRMAEALRDRASERSGPKIQLLRYLGAGHWGFGPARDLHESDSRALGVFGGDAQSDLAARKDQWPKILEFLKKKLGTDGEQE